MAAEHAGAFKRETWAYGEHTEQYMEVYTPEHAEASPPAALAILAHGARVGWPAVAKLCGAPVCRRYPVALAALVSPPKRGLC